MKKLLKYLLEFNSAVVVQINKNKKIHLTQFSLLIVFFSICCM